MAKKRSRGFGSTDEVRVSKAIDKAEDAILAARRGACEDAVHAWGSGKYLQGLLAAGETRDSRVGDRLAAADAAVSVCVRKASKRWYKRS